MLTTPVGKSLYSIRKSGYGPFPHSNKQWHRVEVGVAKIQQMYENVHLSLALVLLFICTEVECGKGLLYCVLYCLLL